MSKKSYFDKNNEYLINWKSVILLKKYMTRFGDIKPRRFTGNSVSQQKKVRKAIIRARELGIIEYIK
ncbi:30S ribosomal protein S18 [Candidatus Vampirococcus lugosii]|uniref:30S ribosomal protein S18 n=1 Tax=Candidatus Vampirococcus lugosii TaxID=2789015 RepID=A0ABS5QLZ1_9BACT|nr:30S ribosomal protein S18 [Candidatus Vampirococcus lugosii]MBS8121793.1 30S ribosomal protein S18 [Candidatus Vampirococcus lugosii]